MTTSTPTSTSTTTPTTASTPPPIPRIAFGVDIGGSGIKGAPVDLATGRLTAERFKIATPHPATPDAVARVVAEVVGHFDDALPPDVPVGVTIPGVVERGVVRTAANIDHEWIGYAGQDRLSDVLGRRCVLVNDADAAGVGEERYGAAREESGFVIVTTLGTGIGVALINHGVLIPNAELGHLEMNGRDAEKQAAASIKDLEGLDYRQWAARLQQYYTMLENLLWPDLIVVGGGVSRDGEKFLPLLDLRTPIVAATLRNAAGIIGAAALAAD